MGKYSLTLIPFRKAPFTVELFEEDSLSNDLKNIIDSSRGSFSVFSDLTYEFELKCDLTSPIENVSVYVNNSFQHSVYQNGRITFPFNQSLDERIFIDCYGFVELGFDIFLEDGSKVFLHTQYLPVLVRHSELNDSVKSMVNYVYENQENLLLNGEAKPKDLAGLKENGTKTLSSQIILAEEIASIYETSFGFFKANRRFRVEKEPVVDNFEKVQYFSPSTLEYISRHPEQLREVIGVSGVRINNRIYQPQKTLSLQNKYSYDIYENKIIVSFLRKMIDEVKILKESCISLIGNIPENEDFNEEYSFSSFFMFSQTRKTLENQIIRINTIYNKLVQLWGMYRNIFKFDFEPLTTIPHATAIFLSVPQYHKIFIHIHQWFNYGVYNFVGEKFMLSFVKISYLYESYLLVKSISLLKEKNYDLSEKKQYVYPPARRGWKYRNTNCFNTFVFKKGEQSLTLYYQPVIYSDERKENNISLYRNNSIAVGGYENGSSYYVPDFMIKIENEEGFHYIICDAKFSTFDTVKKHYLKDLVFKYIFSLTPINANDKILGVSVLHGKYDENEKLKSIYDNELQGNTISPFFDVVPIIEKNNSSVYGELETFFNKLQL